MDCFHQPVNIIISNNIFSPEYCKAIPGYSDKVVDETTEFPLDYQIDYVRLYQREDISRLYVS